MTSVTVFTAARMQEIEDGAIIGGSIVGDHLILEKHDGGTIDAGALITGPEGPEGPAGDARILPINLQTDTAYTPVAEDLGYLVLLQNDDPITLTLPADIDAEFSLGAQVNFAQIGDGQVTIVEGDGVTIEATPGLNFIARASCVTAIKILADTWLVTGSLAE